LGICTEPQIYLLATPPKVAFSGFLSLAAGDFDEGLLLLPSNEWTPSQNCYCHGVKTDRYGYQIQFKSTQIHFQVSQSASSRIELAMRTNWVRREVAGADESKKKPRN